ncbi:hypothetical protein YC2023_056370 [Brassica napus]
MAGHKWNEETRSGTTHGSHIKWVLRRITTAQNLNPTTKATVQNGARKAGSSHDPLRDRDITKTKWPCERRRGSSSRRTSPARISELPKGITYIIFSSSNSRFSPLDLRRAFN